MQEVVGVGRGVKTSGHGLRMDEATAEQQVKKGMGSPKEGGVPC